MTRKKSRKLVVAIGIFKLIKAATLVAVAIGMLRLIGKDPEATAARWLGDLGLDPGSGSLRAVLGKLGTFSIGQLEAITVGTLIYATLFLVEGLGLLRGKRWAEYLTIVITISLIPFEIYELVKEGSMLKIVALVANVAIAVYLIVRVVKDR